MNEKIMNILINVPALSQLLYQSYCSPSSSKSSLHFASNSFSSSESRFSGTSSQYSSFTSTRPSISNRVVEKSSPRIFVLSYSSPSALPFQQLPVLVSLTSSRIISEVPIVHVPPEPVPSERSQRLTLVSLSYSSHQSAVYHSSEFNPVLLFSKKILELYVN